MNILIYWLTKDDLFYMRRHTNMYNAYHSCLEITKLEKNRLKIVIAKKLRN